MQAMDRIFLVCVFFVLSAAVIADAGVAKVPMRYSNDQGYAKSRRDEVVFEKYASFSPVLHLSKRQTDGAAEGNTSEISDHHTYYTSRYFSPDDSADRFWFELSNMIGSGAVVDDLDDNTTEILGDTHRVYQVWGLRFQFPFYGHMLDAVGVTSGGFLYTGTIFHEQVYLTQYIAPLMADFNPSLSESGRVLVYSTEERFTVQWDQVLNHDHANDGPFTFQASIFPNGTIHFAYRKLSLLWHQLNNDDHPVEIGVSDAIYFEIPGFVYIVEYSRVNATHLLPNEDTDLSYSAFEINPVPNCVLADTCESCMDITRLGVFNCSWCEAAEQKCSDGVDRYTQDWLDNGCFTDAMSVCPIATSPPSSTAPLSSTVFPSPSSSVLALSSYSTTLPSVPISVVVGGSSSLPTASVVGIVIGVTAVLLLLIIVGLFIFVIIYGFRHPTSKIGIFMIENRPKAWKLNKSANQTSSSSKYEMSNQFANVYE